MAATNTFATVDKVLNEALFTLENNLAMARFVDRQYSDEFTNRNEKVGGTIRVKLPPRYTWRDGATASAQNTVENTVNIGPIAQGGVDLDVASLDAILSNDLAWKDFSKQRLSPAMAVIANKIDYSLCALYAKVPNWVGTAGTTPATSAVLLDAQTKLDEMACPRGDRYAVVNPKANGGLVDGTKGLFHSSKMIDKQQRTGLMGADSWGFDDVAMDQNINNHIGGAQAGTPAMDTGTLTGNSVTTDGWTSGTTITAGTVFTIAGIYAVNPQNRTSTGSLQQFTILSDVTATGGDATLSIYPAITATGAFQTVTAAPADGALITVVSRSSTSSAGGDPQNLVFHKSAFTLATVDLPLPGGVHFSGRKVHNGISMRVISQYQATSDINLMRFDVAFAVAALRGELACRISG